MSTVRAGITGTVAEIHRAMNEPTPSPETIAVLERVGRTLRDREGRPAGDGPFLRSLQRKLLAEGRAEGRAEERAEGRAEERARLRCRTALRFDAATAERLAPLIAAIDDPARLADVGDWIVVCASGAELLERVRRA